MKLKFWGVRGSIAAPGPETAKVGGNTSCVSVEFGDNLIVFDAGTGIRQLGNSLLKRKKIPKIDLFLSHVHWDHIQGFPFFAPVYGEGISLQVFGSPRGKFKLHEVMNIQMRGPNFPVSLHSLKANIDYIDFKAPSDIPIVDKNGKAIGLMQSTTGNHPNGVNVYRINEKKSGKSIVYATDTEHYKTGMDKRIAEISRNADVLIYDGMYTPQEYEQLYKGWGHSTWEKGLEIASKAGVAKLLIFHHHPEHDDRFMSQFEKEIQKAGKKIDPKVSIQIAREASEYKL